MVSFSLCWSTTATRFRKGLPHFERTLSLFRQVAHADLRKVPADYLNVVDAQRQEYDLAAQYASAQMAAAENFVALYKGLGGGWERYQSIPPIRQSQPAVVAAFRRVLAPEDPQK